MPLCQQVARALLNKGVKLAALGRSEEAGAVYHDLINRFGAASELLLREQIARTLFKKADTLARDLDRSEEAIAVYDDLVERFGSARDLPLPEHVARALYNKGVTLGDLGRSEEAVAVYDDLVDRVGAASELPLRGAVEKTTSLRDCLRKP